MYMESVCIGQTGEEGRRSFTSAAESADEQPIR